MNTQKTVFNKIAQLSKMQEAQLTSEKVELGNMTAIKGAINILKSLDGIGTKAIEKFEAKFKDYYNEYDNVVKARNDIYNFVEREAMGIEKTFATNAKELGINPEDFAEYKELQKWISEGREVWKAIDKDYKRPKF